MISETEVVLPAKFNKLKSYSDWILPDEQARRNKCDTSSMESIRAFYDSMLNSLEKILEHLNGYPLDNMPAAEQNLFSLVLSYVEAAISVEMFEQAEIPFGVSIDRFKPLHHLVP